MKLEKNSKVKKEEKKEEGGGNQEGEKKGHGGEGVEGGPLEEKRDNQV